MSRQDTHCTLVPEREGRGWPTTDDLRRTTVRQRHASDKRAFRKTSTVDVLSSKTGVDRHLYTYIVAELARRSHGDRALKQSTRSRPVNRFEVASSGIIKKTRREIELSLRRRSIRSPGTKPSTTRSAGSVHGQIVDVSTAMQHNVTQNQTTHKKSRTKRLNKVIWVGPPIQ